MRSSKSRSRSKTNRPRTLGNIINRVFDSSGPEGKVRGTPQQLIEKYQQLGRDAQLSNDRVAAENFMQHAEHYTRLLGEAMREMAVEQEARQAQQPMQGQPYNGNGNGNGNNNNNNQRNDRPDYRNDRQDGGQQQQPRFDQQRGDQQRGDGQRGDQPRNDQPRNDQQRSDQQRNDQPRNDQPRNDQQRGDQQRGDGSRQDNRNDNRGDQPRQDRRAEGRDDRRDDRRVVPADVVNFGEVDEETGLVETPEARRAPIVEGPPPSIMIPADELSGREEGVKRARAPRRPRVEADAAVSAEPAVEKPTKPRGPTKPREAAE